MTTELSENEFVARELLPATSKQLAGDMDISVSYARGLISRLRRKGVEIAQDPEGRYYVSGDESDDVDQNVALTRQSVGEKAAKTRRARKFLAEMEHEIKSDLTDLPPARADGGHRRTEGGTDLILHRTDDHFGERVENQDGDVVFDSEIAESRVNTIFDETHRIAETRQAMGEEIDTVNVLLGGDIVTGVTTYPDQKVEVDEDLNAQINRAVDVYLKNIRRLAAEYPSVRVVATPGNHGEIRTGDGSVAANADDIVYSILDKLIRTTGMENVTFVQSDRTHYVNFEIRDWAAHMRHGHDRSLEHIGTSAGKQRWQSWLIDHGFDIAFRGHYHTLKEEPINGVPVYMGGSIVPQTEYEESAAISGVPAVAVHGATDDAPSAWTERVYFA
jgi:hypothetical protein